MPGYDWAGSSGCLLPFLIVFNLFFGKLIFNSTRLWLAVEAILILIFLLKINIMARKISQQFRPDGRGWASDSPSHRPEGHGLAPKGKIIDVQGKVVEDKEKLK